MVWKYPDLKTQSKDNVLLTVINATTSKVHESIVSTTKLKCDFCSFSFCKCSCTKIVLFRKGRVGCAFILLIRTKTAHALECGGTVQSEVYKGNSTLCRFLRTGRSAAHKGGWSMHLSRFILKMKIICECGGRIELWPDDLHLHVKEKTQLNCSEESIQN